MDVQLVIGDMYLSNLTEKANFSNNNGTQNTNMGKTKPKVDETSDLRSTKTCAGNLRRFCTLTSLKGVGRPLRTHDRFMQIIWVVATVGFFGITVFNVVGLLWQFFQFETSTTILEFHFDSSRYAGFLN